MLRSLFCITFISILPLGRRTASQTYHENINYQNYTNEQNETCDDQNQTTNISNTVKININSTSSDQKYQKPIEAEFLTPEVQEPTTWRQRRTARKKARKLAKQQVEAALKQNQIEIQIQMAQENPNLEPDFNLTQKIETENQRVEVLTKKIETPEQEKTWWVRYKDRKRARKEKRRLQEIEYNRLRDERIRKKRERKAAEQQEKIQIAKVKQQQKMITEQEKFNKWLQQQEAKLHQKIEENKAWTTRQQAYEAARLTEQMQLKNLKLQTDHSKLTNKRDEKVKTTIRLRKEREARILRKQQLKLEAKLRKDAIKEEQLQNQLELDDVWKQKQVAKLQKKLKWNAAWRQRKQTLNEAKLEKDLNYKLIQLNRQHNRQVKKKKPQTMTTALEGTL